MVVAIAFTVPILEAVNCVDNLTHGYNVSHIVRV